MVDQTHPNLQRHTGVIPAMQEQTHPNVYPLAGDDRHLTYSNRAVQIWVGLELACKLGWVWSSLNDTSDAGSAQFYLSFVAEMRPCKMHDHHSTRRVSRQGVFGFEPEVF